MTALWENIKSDRKHFADIERLALVGERKWEAGLAVYCKPFTTATIRYLEVCYSEAALAWMRADRSWESGVTIHVELAGPLAGRVGEQDELPPGNANFFWQPRGPCASNDHR